MRPQTLYKIHGQKECDQLQIITRYIHYMGYDMRPITIIERCMPNNINVLPSIVMSNGEFIEGLQNIINKYETQFNIANLLENALNFNVKNPDYKITDRSTHTNIKI
jgi:hypothetical protein